MSDQADRLDRELDLAVAWDDYKERLLDDLSDEELLAAGGPGARLGGVGLSRRERERVARYRRIYPWLDRGY